MAKRVNDSKRKKADSLKTLWKQRFTEKLKEVHSRNIDKMVNRLMKRLDGVKSSMVSRSKKLGVECTITLEDIRELALEAYGTQCKYSGRVLKLDNMVFDHRIPISKGGTSNRDNIQVISKFSNNMKGSLEETHFRMLLEWLDTVPEELKKDVSIRLAHGIR